MNIMFSKKIAYQIIIRNLLLLSTLSFAAIVYASGITASVDRDSIALKETLTLTISVDGQTKNSPDLSGLKNDFDVLSTQRSSSIQVINGSANSSTDWHITLAPKHTGTLLIPSFNVDNAVSDAIEVKVSQQSQEQSDSNEQVRTTIELDKNSVYVQEQIIVKVKLITEVNLSQAELQPLELKNALVVNLDQQQYQTSINGKPHLIVETTFALFPQESGDITIPSLTYTVSIDNMRSIFGDPFGRRRNNTLRLRTDEQHINVKPVPAQNLNKTWQPAKELSLNETWSSSLDHLKIGEPVTRTITINSKGLTGGQIAPTTTSNIDGLTFYPDQAQTKDDKTSKGVQGTRIETTAIVPNRGGDFTLPAVNIDWWNTDSQKMETASLPERKIHVLGDATATNMQTPTPQTLTNTTDNETKNAPIVTINNKENSLTPWILAAIALLAALSIGLACYIWRLKAYINRMHSDQEKHASLLQEKEKNIWDSLKTAASNKDAVALRKAILSWAHFQWPLQKINTLDDIAKIGGNAELTMELEELDKMLYSNHSNPEWNANNLLKLLNSYRKQKKTDSKTTELKNLYTE